MFLGAVETHWTRTVHLQRLWGVVRKAPNVVANLAEVFYASGLVLGSFSFPWDPFGVPFRSLRAPMGSLLAPIWHLWGGPGGRLGN